jgi:hypothetical protein
MKADYWIKFFVRILLVTASGCMVLGNLHRSGELLTASILFLSANVISFVWNEAKHMVESSKKT